jgi:hypothetical protein
MFLQKTRFLWLCEHSLHARCHVQDYVKDIIELYGDFWNTNICHFCRLYSCLTLTLVM